MAEREATFLRFILQASTRQAKLILAQSAPGQIQALGEVCHNLLQREIQPELLKELYPYRLLIRQLADKTLSRRQRREIASKRARSVIEILRLVEEILP